jgi:hypothetical protein
MSRAAYDAMEGINYSTAKALLRSGAHYQAALAAKGKETEEDRKRFIVGSGLHSVILEGKSLTDLYAQKPDGMSFATKEGKAWRAEQTLPVIDAEQVAQIQGMASAINNHPLAKAVLDSCQHREVPLQADVEGVLCRGLVDALGRDRSGNGIIVDLKSSRDASPKEFKRTVEWTLHYDLQAQWYKELARNCDHGDCSFLWVVVENEPPHAVMVYQQGPELVESGNRKLLQVLTTYKECVASGVWSGYQKTPAIEIL